MEYIGVNEHSSLINSCSGMLFNIIGLCMVQKHTRGSSSDEYHTLRYTVPTPHTPHIPRRGIKFTGDFHRDFSEFHIFESRQSRNELYKDQSGDHQGARGRQHTHISGRAKRIAGRKVGTDTPSNRPHTCRTHTTHATYRPHTPHDQTHHARPCLTRP